MGMATECNDGSGSRLGSYDTSMYPGLGPSSLKVKSLLPALVFILSTQWLTRLLELYCLEVEEEVSNLPTLRVQAPLYSRGPGYSFIIWLPGSSMAAVWAWAPLPFGPLPGSRPLYKAPFPLRPAYSGYMPLVCLGSFRGGEACLLRLVEAEHGWRHAGLRPLSILSGPCHL
jgi:hypothetical protein